MEKFNGGFMKEVIGAVVMLVGIYGGTKAIKEIHRFVRKAALEKAAQGLPPLPKFYPRQNK